MAGARPWGGVEMPSLVGGDSEGIAEGPPEVLGRVDDEGAPQQRFVGWHKIHNGYAVTPLHDRHKESQCNHDEFG